MAKRGTAFQRVVADIMRSFGNLTDVEEGTWVLGPDGRRDRDVSFTVIDEPRGLKALIECKDYDPGRTGPIGIEVVDALDSKRRDLGIDLPMICSNAGFTSGALAKAQRVGMRTIGALRMGDKRVRFSVSDAKYSRKLTLAKTRLELLPADPRVDLSKLSASEVLLNGRSVNDWALRRIHAGLFANPITNGTFCESLRLAKPVTLTTPLGAVKPTRIEIRFTLTGAWYEHIVTIDASSGFYDWVKRVPTVSPAAGTHAVRFDNIDPRKGEWVDAPPAHILAAGKSRFLPGEIDMALVLLHGPPPTGPPAELDEYIDPADLIIQTQDYLAENTTSLRGYTHPG
jgi:hypothetical protein